MTREEKKKKIAAWLKAQELRCSSCAKKAAQTFKQLEQQQADTNNQHLKKTLYQIHRNCAICSGQAKAITFLVEKI